jgi:hypothetical protein
VLRNEAAGVKTMRSSKQIRKPHPHISTTLLKEKMSEVISLRERLAQAELEAGHVPPFLKDRALPELVFGNRQTREDA